MITGSDIEQHYHDAQRDAVNIGSVKSHTESARRVAAIGHQNTARSWLTHESLTNNRMPFDDDEGGWPESKTELFSRLMRVKGLDPNKRFFNDLFEHYGSNLPLTKK